jgi:AbrB family looped-hinge helix DNA binding protein
MIYGTMDTMKAGIDKAGRIVIPKAARDAVGLEPGTEVELRIVDDSLQLRPAATRVRLVRRGRIVTAVADPPPPPLTADEVERTRERLRSERVRDM